MYKNYSRNYIELNKNNCNIFWRYNEFKSWYDNGRDSVIAEKVKVLDFYNYDLKYIPNEIGLFKNVELIILSYNKLTEIPKQLFNLENIKKLVLTSNYLTYIPQEIKNLQNLEELYITSNKLKDIPKEIGNLKILKSLYVNMNQLKEIPCEIGYLENLEILDVSNNCLKRIPKEIENLHKLCSLQLSLNILTNIPPEITKLRNLLKLVLDGNKIQAIPSEIENIHLLVYFSIQYNNIKVVPSEVALLQNIKTFYIYNNPIEYIPPNVERMLYRLRLGNVERYRLRLGFDNTSNGIYNDRQSVHNHSIQETFRETVFRLLNDYNIPKQEKTNKIYPTPYELVMNEIMNDRILKKQTKEQLIEYINDKTPHSVLNITFEELLFVVWKRIQRHREKDEIKKILNQEMTDVICICFTGRLTRLVNCLNGFYDDIKINISSNEQISNIILQTKKKLERNDEYSREKHIEQATKELKERNYENETIQEWMSYID
jgi:Leucine-rich repeat (LRR) protein